jgi:hypothetical protein
LGLQRLSGQHVALNEANNTVQRSENKLDEKHSTATPHSLQQAKSYSPTSPYIAIPSNPAQPEKDNNENR